MKVLVRNIIAGWLQRQVSLLIRQRGLKVVGVTGSFGKTSTKLAIASVLGQKYKVLAHEGNYNTELGMPLAVFEQEAPRQLANPLAWLKIAWRAKRMRANYPYDVLVLEFGIDHPRDMDALLRYIRPDFGVVTAVAGVHIENFIDIDEIADEKFKLALGSAKAVINTTNPYLSARAEQLLPDYISFGTKGDYKFTGIKVADEGLAATLNLGKTKMSVQTHVIAEHALLALEAAAAVGEHMGLSHDQIREGIESFRPVSGRMNPIKGVKGALVIDDSYNSSPDAAVAALETLRGLAGKRMAILGSMNELGSHAEAGHRRVGAVAAQAGLDLLVTIGENAEKYLADEARKTMDPKKVVCFQSPYEAGEYVRPLLTAKHVVLVKGSQNRVFSEEATKELLASRNDVAKLVRQSDKWMKIKNEQFR